MHPYTKQRVALLGVVFLVLSGVSQLAAQAPSPRPEVRSARAGAELRAASSRMSRIVDMLVQGELLVVQETTAKKETIGGVSAPWFRVERASGESGWVFGAQLSALPARGFYTSLDLPSGCDYDAYLALVARRGERVRAVMDFEAVKRGERGWLYGRTEREPPYLVVWDRDLDAVPRDDALPPGLPRILEDRIYFVDANVIELAGEEKVADFTAMGLAWARERAEEFGVGARVTLGKHYSVSDDKGSANWTSEMDVYVGKTTRIEELCGDDPWGRPIAKVSTDGGEWVWRLENMRLAGEDDVLDSEDDGLFTEKEGESYGAIDVGTLVILGRHDAVAGDDNWNDEMGRYVGTTAKVIDLSGADAAGFLGVRVEGNDWFWRVRNLAVPNRGMPGSYGFDVGDKVILGRHRLIEGSGNWAAAMENFVGKTATITSLLGSDGDRAGCFLVRVDVDGGKWAWRVENLTPAR